MKRLKYYISRSPLVKGKFMAKTVSVNTYNDQDLIKEMMIKDRNIGENEIKRVLKLLISVSVEILSGGNNILIPDFLKISPMIQGAFGSPKEVFDPKKHHVSLNFNASPAFMKNFQSKIKVQKTEKKGRYPFISEVNGKKSVKNVISCDYANFFSGNYLTPSGKELNGISIIMNEAAGLKSILGREDFQIISFSSKELIFNISRKWTAPSWLVKDCEIHIRLRYINSRGEISETEAFKVKWE